MKLLPALAAALVLAACGQTGPLRLPPPKPGAPVAAPVDGTGAAAAEKPKTTPSP